jgi:hypothetical protein
VVSTDRPDYQVGKAVEVRAVRQPGADQATAAGEVSVQVVDESGKGNPVPMKASSTEPDVFVGSFYPRVSGRYQAQATLAAAGVTTANQTTEFLVQGSNLELADPAANPERLRTIARLTGGAYYDVADVGRLSGQIERRERVISRRERTEFWNSPSVRSGLFVFFLAAVTGEWVLRRRNHML